jgi:hypothetical protein
MDSQTVEAALPFRNPYRPGAGHMPPYLAGREAQVAEFDRLLEQDQTILDNMVLTGLRGVGKTVLLETFKPRALAAGWLWVGADLSESASVSEHSLATRLITDLAVATAGFTFQDSAPRGITLKPDPGSTTIALSHDVLVSVYDNAPGLVADKIKTVLEFTFEVLRTHQQSQIVFAYDEAQNMADHPEHNEYPLSVMLDVFQSIQRKGIPFMLVLTGLPTLFPKLVDARTYAERMFRVVTLTSLDEAGSRAAILKPIEAAHCPVSFERRSVRTIIEQSAGYPYFIQFICREVFDVFIVQMAQGITPGVPVDAIQLKLDSDFFAGRWAKVTERQRQLLWVIAQLDRPDEEFTIQELVEGTKRLLAKPFSPSHANQMVNSLADLGLVFRNRFGRYSFAVPLMGGFIRRTYQPPSGSLRPS